MKNLLDYNCFFFFLDLVFLLTVAGYTFYQGYRVGKIFDSSTENPQFSNFFFSQGTAASVSKNKRRYETLQSLLSIVYIVLSLVRTDNLHGFLAFGSDVRAMSSFYDAVVIVESSLLLITACVSLTAVYKVHKYSRHAYEEAVPGGF